jgi:hypothetical protein
MAEISGHATMSGKAVYDMITGGPGTWTMDRAHDAAEAQSTTQQEINEEIAAIAAEIRGGWTGNAADGAHAATQPLSDGAAQSSRTLRTAQEVHAGQGQHFAHTANSVEKIADGPPQTGVWDSLTPWDTDTEDAVNEYNAKSQRNVELYRAYGTTTAASERGMPREYGTFPEFHGEFAVHNSPGPGAGRHTPPPNIGNVTAAAAYGGESGGGATPGPVGTPGHGTTAHPPGAVPDRQSGPAPARPAAIAPIEPSPAQPLPARPAVPTPGIAAIPGPGGTTGTGPASGPRSAGGPGTPRTAPGFGAAGGAVPGGTSGTRGSGRAGTSGRIGGPGTPRTAQPPRTGQSPRTPGTPPAEPESPGGRTGATPGAAAAAESAAARGAAANTPNRSGVAGIPPGAGKTKEDEEHRRKTILEEPDAEGIFGTDQRTAPPVIGDDRVS